MAWWNSWFRKGSSDAQLDSELRFHVEELTKANIAAGMAPAEARRQALLEFGGPEQIKEELRDVYRHRIADTMLANLRSAFRFIRKSPSFSIAVILTLALGIGANSAVFSAIDAILLRPLPFPDGDQLMRLAEVRPKLKSPETFVAPERLEDWNRMNSTFQAITGYYTDDSSEISGSLPEKLTRAMVAPRFLQVWGIAPALGRDFQPEEEHVGGPDAVLISDRYWRRRFGADPDVLRKKLRIGGSSYSIVGVMPASFLFPMREVDVWSPVPVDGPYTRGRENTWYAAVGRLKPSVGVEPARANLATVQAQLGKAFPKPDGDIQVLIEPLKEATVGGVRESLWVLFGSVSLLLLIACTNIVALLLARATQRRHEISVRFSLGASRGGIISQLLTEAFVLAVTGAALGLIVARGTSNIFRALAGNLPRIDEVHLDMRVVWYSLGCSVGVTLLCGLFPAIRGTRRGLAASIAQTSRTQVAARNRLQWALVGVQVALAVALLGGAGLLLRSFQALGRVSPGFEMDRVLTLHISASWGETADMAALAQRIAHIREELRSVPGVQAVATSAALPGAAREFPTELKVVGGENEVQRKIVADSRFVSPEYFDAMKIPRLAGEGCRENLQAVELLINRSFANAYFQGGKAIGRRVEVLGRMFLKPGEIRGIVGDARETGVNHEPAPTVYWCWGAPLPDPFYLVRTHGDPMAMAQTLREKIHEIEPARSVFDIAPLSEHLDDAFAENRLRTVLLAFFAVTAVSLACVGLYGTLSYAVNVRRREVGLRLALGALRGQIAKRFLIQGVGISLLGCVAGWGLALGFGQVLSGMLYGVSPSDPLTLSGVVLLVLGVAVVASLAPAVRAARLEPMQVLREE
jgi:putative ABC transport system permease protein